jgi:hypothetical protein
LLLHDSSFALLQLTKLVSTFMGGSAKSISVMVVEKTDSTTTPFSPQGRGALGLLDSMSPDPRASSGSPQVQSAGKPAPTTNVRPAGTSSKGGSSLKGAPRPLPLGGPSRKSPAGSGRTSDDAANPRLVHTDFTDSKSQSLCVMKLRSFNAAVKAMDMKVHHEEHWSKMILEVLSFF